MNLFTSGSECAPLDSIKSPLRNKTADPIVHAAQLHVSLVFDRTDAYNGNMTFSMEIYYLMKISLKTSGNYCHRDEFVIFINLKLFIRAIVKNEI